MKSAIIGGVKGAWIRGVWHPNRYLTETYVPQIIHEKWFVESVDYGFEIFDTEAEAKERFLKVIEDERDVVYQEGEWNTEIEDTYWGKIYQDCILRKVPNPYNNGVGVDDEDYDTEDYYEAFANERGKP